jgi:hypothetical protein
MTIYCDKLWKLFIEKVNKTYMKLSNRSSYITLAKLSKEAIITLEVLKKIWNEIYLKWAILWNL